MELFTSPVSPTTSTVFQCSRCGCGCLVFAFCKNDMKSLHFSRRFLPSWVSRNGSEKTAGCGIIEKWTRSPPTYSAETLVGCRWHRSVWSSLWLSLRVHPCGHPCPWLGSPRGTPPWLPGPCWEGLSWWSLGKGAETPQIFICHNVTTERVPGTGDAKMDKPAPALTGKSLQQGG